MWRLAPAPVRALSLLLLLLHLASSLGEGVEAFDGLEGLDSLAEACSAFDAQAPRVVIGCWQILERHADEKEAVRTLSAYAAAGFTTFDTADIYGRSETILGSLRSTGVEPVVHTKFVTGEAGEGAARAVNERSRRALGGVPDLVAFHWWDNEDPRFVQAAHHLTILRNEGNLGQVAACNFDLPHLKAMVDAGALNP